MRKMETLKRYHCWLDDSVSGIHQDFKLWHAWQAGASNARSMYQKRLKKKAKEMDRQIKLFEKSTHQLYRRISHLKSRKKDLAVKLYFSSEREVEQLETIEGLRENVRMLLDAIDGYQTKHNAKVAELEAVIRELTEG